MELRRTPYDLLERESELVSGYNIEYRGFGFTLLFLGEYSGFFLDPGTTWPYIRLKTIYRLICFYGPSNHLSSLASAKVYPSYQVFMEISKLVYIYFLSRFSLIPVFVLVIYGRFINCIGLVTFPIATVFVVVFLVSLICILIKLLGVRRYLISFLSHFTPAGVNVN